MDVDPKVTFECPECRSKDIRYPATHLPNDPATCVACNRTYAYGDMLEVASRRLLMLLAAERRRSEKLLAEAGRSSAA